MSRHAKYKPKANWRDYLLLAFVMAQAGMIIAKLAVFTEVFPPADYGDTEGPCCDAWAAASVRGIFDDKLCVHDSCWRIMGVNANPPSYRSENA